MKQYTDQLFKDKANLFTDVLLESNHQVEKWGIQTHSLFEWLNYTTEEIGELAKAVAEHHYRSGSEQDIYNEAIQLATLSLKIAEMVKNANKS
ncbi:hypothetical protein LCGC14_0635920 [marine sediment metagenome]|uniref:Uncharacterized protein n=1 Tax=marine sediment metagenome TaxID=412755 RepID=A0A0F9R5S4_9ZZZZ